MCTNCCSPCSSLDGQRRATSSSVVGHPTSNCQQGCFFEFYGRGISMHVLTSYLLKSSTNLHTFRHTSFPACDDHAGLTGLCLCTPCTVARDALRHNKCYMGVKLSARDGALSMALWSGRRLLDGQIETTRAFLRSRGRGVCFLVRGGGDVDRCIRASCVCYGRC